MDYLVRNEILSDNGGEFNNDLLCNLSDQLNVFTKTTPGVQSKSISIW